jgi:AcrR family transcriptional regulator
MMMPDDQKPSFQRARSAEQREERRTAILHAASELLEAHPVRDISLRELARRVDLSKTNVVRYFETREAVFFALLNQALDQWLATLPEELGTDKDVTALTGAFAASVARQPMICKLWSALGGELESNISPETVRGFKLAHAGHQAGIARALCTVLPELGEAGAREFVAAAIVLVAGLWPFANPSAEVVEALEHPELAASRVDFAEHLARLLQLVMTGILIR